MLDNNMRVDNNYQRREELLRFRRLLLYSHGGGVAATTEDNEGFWLYGPEHDPDTKYRLIFQNYWIVDANPHAL